jgi:hypothetical protein
VQLVITAPRRPGEHAGHSRSGHADVLPAASSSWAAPAASARASQQAEHDKPTSHEGKEDEQVPEDFHCNGVHGCGLPRPSTISKGLLPNPGARQAALTATWAKPWAC